jgi:transcription elongation factor GreA
VKISICGIGHPGIDCERASRDVKRLARTRPYRTSEQVVPPGRRRPSRGLPEVAGRPLTAAGLLRDVGLMADGPVRWAQPVRVGGPGVYVVELAAPLPEAPIDLAKVGKWLERLPAMRLDGARPTSRQVAARLASFWWPDQAIVYIGMTANSIGGRVRAFYETPLGDRRPHRGGHWLKTLRSLDGLRVWWASTDAAEEYEDAALDAFSGSVSGGLPARPAGALPIPWANLERSKDERQPHGLTGYLVPEEAAPVAPAGRVVQLAPGNADGTSTEVKGTGVVRRAPASSSVAPPRPGLARPGLARPAPARPAAARPAAAPKPPVGRRSAAALKADRPREPVQVTAASMASMRAELEELTRVKRPEVVQRIKSAREYGDLKENAEYHAAREEQSFLEGRIRLLEDRLRFAVVTEEPAAADRGRVALGSVVKVEQDGDELTFTIVGTTEANPAAGRISTASPVGAALLGAVAGDEVEVRTPRGASRYRIVAVE